MCVSKWVKMPTDLPEVCDKLCRDAGARKVMLCASDGEVLAHAGVTGAFDEAATDAIAQLVADVMMKSAAPDSRAPSGDPSGQMGLTGPLANTDDVVITIRGTLQACASPAGPRAALVVLFDGSTSLERIRQKMRRARTVLEKSLSEPAKPESPREPS
jgi:hypothetical protein